MKNITLTAKENSFYFGCEIWMEDTGIFLTDWTAKEKEFGCEAYEL